MDFFKRHSLAVFNFVAGFASIVSVLFLVFSDEANALIALAFFCLFLLITLFSILRVLQMFVRKENERDHKKVSVFTTFETLDETHSRFETYRVIQSKRLVLSEVDQNFKWSGSKMPRLSSDLQTIRMVQTKDGDYDKAVLVLKRPLVYNETCTIHFRAEMDDFDGKAQPHLDYRVDMSLSIIHFRVILRHKGDEFARPAKVLRRRVQCEHPADYEEIGSVAFDKRSRSYQYNLIDPEVGYYYRLTWEK